MATSRQTVQTTESGLGNKDLEANLSGTYTHSTAIAGRGTAARMFTYVGDLDEICFFVALCGLWTSTFLHGLLVFSYCIQSAPNHDSICWSLATIFWGIVALSVHSIRYASRSSRTRDPSNTRTLSTQTRIAEALTLTVFIAWYRDLIAQKSPYEELFSMCDSSAQWEVGYAGIYYYWRNPLVGITLSQCDIATAIVNVTWVGPIALLFAVWAMLFRWINSATEALEIVPDMKEPTPTSIKSVLFPTRQIADGGTKELEHKLSTSVNDILVDCTAHS